MGDAVRSMTPPLLLLFDVLLAFSVKYRAADAAEFDDPTLPELPTRRL